MDRSGISILFDLLQKAAQYTSVADYLFDFHSQGLITVRSSTASSPWMSVGSYFSDCSDVFLAFSLIYFEISPVNHGKSNSGGPVNSGSSPPGVHQTGGPDFG